MLTTNRIPRQNNGSKLTSATLLKTSENLPVSSGQSSVQDMVGTKQGKVMTLFSTLSGVGKTTVAINLAAWLGKIKGTRTCIVDADLQFGDVCNYLRINPEYTLADLAKHGVSEQTLNAHAQPWLEDIDILAAPREIEEADGITAGMMSALIGYLRTRYEYVIIDTCQGFNENTLAAIDSADIIVVVGMIDSVASVKKMKLGLDTLKGLGYSDSKIKVVLNRSNAKTPLSIPEVERVLGTRFDKLLSNDYSSAQTALYTGIPFVLGQPDTELARQMITLAKAVTEDSLNDVSTKPKLFHWLNRWFNKKG